MGDIFDLQLLQHHKPAPDPSNCCVQTYIGTVRDTFPDAARAMGLIQIDEEYELCLQQASNLRAGKELRYIFVTLTIDGAPAKKLLWKRFMKKNGFTEDFRVYVHV